MILNENLFEEIKEETPYVEEASKSVPDSDGFMTDYTWYTNGKKHIFIFGDSDLYGPESWADHEIEIYPGNEENAYEEAKEWFDNYKGFEEELDEYNSINEDFSSTLPKWLINFLLNNKKYKDTISSKMNLDLANMKYVKIPKDEIPTNGFHPIMKDNTKQLVYLLRDLNRNIVYFPGINDDTSLYIDPNETYKSILARNLSKKQLLDYTIQMGYIEMDDSSNFNKDKQKERRLSREGALERGKGQYEYEDREYPLNPETLRRNYGADPIITKKWLLTKGQDKSGYPIDKDKYKKMLDQADMQTYSRQYERYTKKLEALRSAIIDYISGMSLTKSKGNWGSNLQSAVSKFEDAIKDFEDLQKSIERILSHENLNDEEKNKYIQMEFDGNEAFNSISSLRKNIENAWKYLNELKDKQLEEELSSSSVEEENEDPMAILAKKHDLDILSPMGTEPGSMRVSGTVRDLDNFYKEAEELGLLNLNENQEFQKIANEVGLTEKDLNLFKKEEVNLGESNLDAIKRYKRELIESGVDLSKVRKESLKEALYGKDEFDEFITLANQLGFTTIYQMKHIMNAAKSLGKSELEMLKDIDKTFNGKIPDSLIDGLTDTFLTVAKEVGIETDDDYKRFIKEEVGPGETITQAILRYRDEINDLNLEESQATGIKGRYQVQVFDEGDWHDLNRWPTIEKAHQAGQSAIDAVYQNYRVIDRETGNEVLEESVMSNLNLELKYLKEEIPELKNKIKDLNYDIEMAGRGGNSDSSEISKLEKEIEELTQSLKEKEDRLAYIEKTYK